MTPEQTKAITACIEAFNIPRDCDDFTLKIYVDHCFVASSLGDSLIAAHLDVEHHPASPSEV